ncbi:MULTISPECIES: 50S ribosomal protein L25/general stress protein Ctc [unclassified Pseudoclavibacter]|uniref:50S ribosomal protein L25/general stress protein Ctc n=1 Tax=unclassified Pseudoclavibacter TaxID=2615177 RepID=UPI000CE782B3|nr:MULTISPECIES: 50S ribosomal protein L25/general stress protein Ctc [unclassified Pseudoclavibacter]MBF4549835.1 50S ribosomal protein L25/general stress protein Ctc [Pseudoclavibacter sp. VKM Ac-2888]PPF39677.1 50S ribosomal protein L25 [Pseudoclavibacter sp. AY1H1]PPF76247.1 50S ribosomal protein L25 [Pseudoclavibacter sp. Z016]PPG03141.1 50S ribosomal protein L25 [Pseudoclavibacter sp. RFBI5]
MAETNKLSVELRESFGKGAARKIRAAGKIPAVLYGHGTEPRHLTLPGHETMLLIRKANALIELDIEGDTQLALVRDVQRDPVRQIIEHLDLAVIRKGERVEVDVPLHLIGEPFPGTIAVQDATTILVAADATAIPSFIEVSVEGLEDGTLIHREDLKLPEGTVLVDLAEDAEEVALVSIQTPRGEDEDEDAEEEAAAAE